MSLVLGVIPARYASTRFPGKVLAPLHGMSMLERVWRRARDARRIDRLVIATDERRVLDASRAFGAEACLTASDHASGTDRVAEVSRELGEEYAVVLNVQADEPLITPSSLDALVACFEREPRPRMATLAEAITDPEVLFDPHAVKVVVANDGNALYFSRSAIPYFRGAGSVLSHDFRDALRERPSGLTGYRKHQGVYAYDRATLQELTRLPPSALELDEGLEQLRALQAGYSIRVVESDFRSVAVDTPADLERVAGILTEVE